MKIERAASPGKEWYTYAQYDDEVLASDCLVARDGDLIVGAIFFAPFGDRRFISAVAVRPSHRRRGIGAALYRAAADAMGVSLGEILPHYSLSDDGRAVRAALGMAV